MNAKEFLFWHQLKQAKYKHALQIFFKKVSRSGEVVPSKIDYKKFLERKKKLLKELKKLRREASSFNDKYAYLLIWVEGVLGADGKGLPALQGAIHKSSDDVLSFMDVSKSSTEFIINYHLSQLKNLSWTAPRSLDEIIVR